MLVCDILTVMHGTIITLLEATIWEFKYPSLIGEPTKEDIIGTLQMTLDYLLSDGVDPDEYSEALERIEELETGVCDAISELDDLVDDMKDGYEDRFDEIMTKANSIKYDLQSL